MTLKKFKNKYLTYAEHIKYILLYEWDKGEWKKICSVDFIPFIYSMSNKSNIYVQPYRKEIEMLNKYKKYEVMDFDIDNANTLRISITKRKEK